MNKIDKLLNDFLNDCDKEKQLNEGVIWEEKPITYEEFIVSNKHMNFPPYSERQLDGMNYLFGLEPEKSFNNGVSLIILQYGKGCLSKESVLEDAFTHEKFTIEELYNKNKSIYVNCYDELNKKSTIEKASIPWISGYGEIYEVKTESGKSINVYKHHQFLTKEGWKKLSELNIGDEILDDSIEEANKEVNTIVNNFKEEIIRKKISAKVSGKNNPIYGKDAPKGSGRCKYYLFKNNKNEEFYLQGTWELKFASFLNDKDIYWIKNKDRFNYKNNKNEECTYCPDFKLFFENESIYIEIKGFEDENVESKINAVKKTGNNIYIIREKTFRNYYLNYETPILKFEKIKSIKYLRNDNYYDLEVDKYHNYLAHGLYNHNSGKDTICCHAVLYCVYLLLCCKNPHKLFRGIDATSYMDIVNVAYNIQQARDVFFTKLVEAVKKWKWLREKYKFVESGKSKKLDKKYENEDVVNIKSDEIRFPKYIRAVTRCSQQNAAEGLNVLLWILDEFSAFSDKNNKSNAMEMFNTLKSSSITRFGNQSKGFVISFPRYKDDPIQKLSEMYRDDLSVYIDKASTFEVKPKQCFCDNWVDWNGRSIPEDFLSEFKRDPENSLAKYFCEPPEMSDPYFTDIQKIDESIDVNKKQLFEVREKIINDPITNSNLVTKEIINKNYNNPNASYVICGDIGLSNDISALGIWHKETLNIGNGQEVSKIIQDCLITWVPNKQKNLRVDITNVVGIINKIIFDYKLPIIGVYFDHYNTAQMLQDLRNKNINAQAYTLTTQDFYDIRTKIYDGKVKFLNIPEQITEIKRLRNTTSGKPDHVEDGHDDMWRSSCLAITMLDGNIKNKAVVFNEDGMFINKKLSINENQIDNDFEGDVIKANFHNANSNDFDVFDLPDGNDYENYDDF